MTKRRPARQSRTPDRDVLSKHFPKSNGKARASSSSPLAQWCAPSTLLKVAFVVAIAAVGPVVVLNDVSLRNSWFSSSSSPEANGGWRLADETSVARLDSDLCHVDRVSVEELGPERFEAEFRYKRPVLVTFPRGAADWTDPAKWTLHALKR